MPPPMMPVGGLTMTSLSLTAMVVGNAYYQKKQFYPSVVYITKSNTSMAAIYLLAFTIVILTGKLLKRVFFGQLRMAEYEHLIERSFYAVTETCLAFTVFRDDFSPKFVALFTVLLFLKVFHWLCDSRVDFMERSPIITVLFHIRVSGLLLLLTLLDLFLVRHAYYSTVTKGASVQLVFGFEYAILLTMALNIAVKYVCHTIDLRSENPWENKAVYLLYTELLVGFVKVLFYVVFLLIMIQIHTFPLFIIRPMYLTVRSFKKALNDVIQSRRAIHNMNTLYPDATPQELAAVDNICIICREEMVTGAKKLPCGHIFHSSCLRSWFQRQQTCPTCRMDILRQTVVPPQQAAPQQLPRMEPNAPPRPPNANAAAGAHFPFGQFPNPFLRPPHPPQAPSVHTSSAATSSSRSIPSSVSTNMTTPASAPQHSAPFNLLPPFFPFIPFAMQAPAPPPNFSGLTLDELRAMEGQERANVEARIKVLKNIQTLLDAAVVQLQQYNTVISNLESQATVLKESVDKTEDKGEQSDTSNVNMQQSSSTSDNSIIKDSDSPNADCESPIADSELGACAMPSQTHEHASQVEGTSSQSTLNDKSPPSTTSQSPQEAETDRDDPMEIRRRRLEKFSTDMNGFGSSLS